MDFDFFILINWGQDETFSSIENYYNFRNVLFYFIIKA